MTSSSHEPSLHEPRSPGRTLTVASEALRLIGEAASERALLAGVSQLLVEQAGYALAWIGEVRSEPERTVDPICWCGDADYVRGANVRWDAGDPRGAGPTGRAIRAGTPVAFNALVEDPAFEPWRDAAAAQGYEASCALPLRVRDEIVAVLNVYAYRPSAFDHDELHQLTDLADAIARGLQRFRSEEETDRVLERLRQANAQLRAIYEGSPDLIFLHAADGRLLDVNHHVTATYGMTKEELLAAPVHATVGGAHTTEEALARVRQAVEEGGVDFEWTARRADRSEMPVEVRLRRLGEPPFAPDEPAVVAVVRDLTERRRYQDRLLEAARLESLAMLAGGVAHDFNNALSAVFGALGVASRELPADATARGLIEDAMDAAESARGLTRQLLTFARGGAGIPTVFPLGPLVERAARLALAGTSIVFEVDVPEDLPNVRADRDQLSQVFHNLLLNAAQAMPGGGRVTVRIRAEGRWIRVDVEDTGVGIAPADRARLFDPFFTTKPGGTGLGLPTAAAAVRRHGGEIAVDSAPGVGTTFTVRLPAVDEPASDVVSDEPRELRRGLRVLVLEDEEPLQRVFARLFEQLGHEALIAPEGGRLLALARDERDADRPLDLALVDLTVRGGRGGADVLAELRELLGDTPVIGMSGYSETDPSSTPFDAFLPKPFSVEQLEQAIARCV